MSDLVALPESLDAHSLAEWLELAMLVEEIHDFSTTEMLALFPSGRRPPVQDVELALGIVEERAADAPGLYPFRRSEDRVVLAGHPDSEVERFDASLYTFFRIACLQDAPWVQRGHAPAVGALFDYPVRDAMVQWLGQGSASVVFGWPPREGRPTDFVEAVSWLAELLGLPDGDLDRPPDANDGGVDIVVWKPPADQRSGFPVWLVQASVEHGVVDKAKRTIPVESWKRWIKFGAGPATAFATAHDVPKGSNAWMELNDVAFHVADRRRLLTLLDTAGIAYNPPGWLDAVRTFTADELDAIRNPQPGATVPGVRRRKRERTGPYADPRAR